MKKTAPCSALICVYEGAPAKYFVTAVESLYNQTLPPAEVVVVGDGPLKEELSTAISKFEKKYDSFHFYARKENHGVGSASNYGIKKAKYDLIAKMDADDISVPDRFEKQIAKFDTDPELALLGGQIAEFANDDPKQIVSHREVPLTSDEIKQFARRRSPMNNPTIMFRKKSVEAVGCYPELNRAEDYLLFVKMIAAGQKLENLPDVLVNYRLSTDNTKRRKNWRHTKEMIHARKEAYKLGVASWFDYQYMKAAFVALYIIPDKLSEKIYKKRLRTHEQQ